MGNRNARSAGGEDGPGMREFIEALHPQGASLSQGDGMMPGSSSSSVPVKNLDQQQASSQQQQQHHHHQLHGRAVIKGTHLQRTATRRPSVSKKRLVVDPNETTTLTEGSKAAADARKAGGEKKPFLRDSWGQDHGYSGMTFSMPDRKKGDKASGATAAAHGPAGEGKTPAAGADGDAAVRERLNSEDFQNVEATLLADIQAQYDRLAAVREKTGDAEKHVKHGRLLIVTYRLPFKLQREEESWRADELDREQCDVPYFDMQAVENHSELSSCTWIGWPSVEVDPSEQSALRDQLKVRSVAALAPALAPPPRRAHLRLVPLCSASVFPW